jgi:ABC-2 type transport system permease protein
MGMTSDMTTDHISYEPRKTRPLYWSIRRELWENRSIYLAPLAVAALFLIGFLLSTIHMAARIRAAALLTQASQAELIAKPYNLAAMMLMGATFLVAIFYSLDALYGERRDRSTLFWKSMPVSDVTTVLSKAAIPIVILPLVTFAVTVATQLVMLTIQSLVLVLHGLDPAIIWNHLPLFAMWLMLLGHLVIVHGFFYAPVYAWLLFVSAWARRAVFLWATLPLLAIGIAEKIAFSTSQFAAMLGSRISGGPGTEAFPDPGTMSSMGHLPVLDSLLSAGMWIGLVVAALLLAAAVRLRRYREPI